MKRLADIADVRTGYPFRGKVRDDPKGNLAVVQMKDVSDVGQLDLQDCIHISEEPAHGRHLLRQGDVLLQSRGAKFPAGLVDIPVHGIAALGLHVLSPTNAVHAEYLAWVMNHPTTRSALQGMARGSYIPFLSRSDLAELSIPLPPPQTQKRIAEVARLERQTISLASKLQDLRDQYTAAVTWRAANQDREK